jgi:protein ImuB
LVFASRLASHAEYRRLFRIPSPTGNVEVLFRVLHTHLENFTTESPESVGLASWRQRQPCRRASSSACFETALRDPNQFFETLARLNALLGPESAGTPILADTHKPDAFQLVVPDFTIWKHWQPRCRAAGVRPAIAPLPSAGSPRRSCSPNRSPQPSPPAA